MVAILIIFFKRYEARNYYGAKGEGKKDFRYLKALKGGYGEWKSELIMINYIKNDNVEWPFEQVTKNLYSY